jgi:ribosome-binding factor A
MQELDRNNKFIRHALGQRIRNQVKNVPEIQFFLDDSLEYIDHIEQALKND